MDGRAVHHLTGRGDSVVRQLGLAACIVAASALPSFAEDAASADPMAPLYGNTIVLVDKGGIESHTYYSADHTFAGVAPAYSYKYQGTWELKADGTLCRTFNPEPPGVKNPDCGPFVAHAIGDAWEADGGKFSIVAGVQ